jgi:hypothetical protein
MTWRGCAMSEAIETLWTPKELGSYLGLSPKTIITLASRAPDRLPPRVAVMSSPRWEPGIVRAWVVKHSGGVKRKGGRPRGS